MSPHPPTPARAHVQLSRDDHRECSALAHTNLGGYCPWLWHTANSTSGSDFTGTEQDKPVVSEQELIIAAF